MEEEYWKRAREIIDHAEIGLEAAFLNLEEPVPESLADRIHAIAALSGEEDPVIEWLWGCAVAQTIVALPQHLDVACGLVEKRFLAKEAVKTNLAQQLQTPQRSAVLSALQQVVTQLEKHPEIGVSVRHREAFRHYLQDWRKIPVIERLWDNRLNEIPWSYSPLWILEILRPNEPGLFLNLLEVAAFPPALDWIFYDKKISGNLSEIAALLQVAPLCAVREENGDVRWNEKLTAPILLSVALNHVERQICPAGLYSDNHDELDQKAAELFTKLARVLIGREDGCFLGIRWLGHLVGAEKRRHAGRSNRWSPELTAINVLVGAMAEKRWSLKEVRAAFPTLVLSSDSIKKMRQSGTGEVQRNDRPSGTDAFLVAVLLEQADASIDQPSNDGDLLSLYGDLLIRQDHGLYSFSDVVFPVWRQWCPAKLYMRMPDPACAWVQTWLTLAEQRRRVRHRKAETGADDPSFFHICLGISLIDWLLSEDNVSKRNVIEACWNAVFEATFSMCLSQERIGGERWKHAMAKLFARLPHFARNFASNDPIEMVASQLERINTDGELLTWCTSMVLNNDVKASDLADSLHGRGINLKACLADFADWEQRPGRRGRPSPLGQEARLIADQLLPVPK